MLKIFARKFSFCIQAKKYEKYLNNHIKKSLESVSTPSKIKSKQACEKYFQQLSNLTQNEDLIKTRMNMVFSAAFQLQNFDQQRKIICEMIIKKKIQSQSQLDRIIKYVFKEIKWNCSIGQKQIEAFLDQLGRKERQFQKNIQADFETVKQDFSEKNANNLCKKYRQLFPQVDSKRIFDRVNSFFKNCNLTPKEPKTSPTKDSLSPNCPTIQQNKFWHKIQNIKPRLIKQQLNTQQIVQQHKLITGGKLRFRFPPQPNGYLHIGHIKSIRMNFQTAKRLGGECYLRYDDTNPQKEAHEFIQEIERNVKWMGYTPDRVNFTSDYFQQMLDYANRLVKEGKAYVCESTQDQIEAERKEKRINPFRMRDKEFSQKIFPYLTPTQTLRLKLDPTSANPTLRDPIIYRYKHHPHPKTGFKYKIYPMYDFAHCISDSLEHIDYSLCSLEFEIRRQLYYRILDMLGLYKPIVWQFSRLNVKGNVISKRKIKQLIDDRKIQGWDDPRLLTIKGMQRRGYTPKMLNQFIDKVNASRSGNQKYVRIDVLQKEMKKQLAKNSQKIVALKNPLQVLIHKCPHETTTSEHQKLASLDFLFLQKEQLEKIQPNKQIILKQAGVYILKREANTISIQQSKKTVQEVKKQNEKVPILSWLSEQMIEKKVVLFDSLVDDNEEFNTNSLKEITLWIDKEMQEKLNNNHEDTVYLFERIGYFKKDNKNGELICCTEV